MSELNRNQFKGSTLNSIKDEQSRAEKALPMGGPSNRPGFLTIEDGKNYRRVAPSHSPTEPAYRAVSTVTLECEVSVLDGEGNDTGKKEVKRKSIFIATQHSSVVKEDPISIYIQYVQKRANDEIQDKDERAKFLYPINGWRGKDGKWNWGIKPSIEYVCYCWDQKGVLGRERLYPYLIDTMKKISVERADSDVEIVPDIFTDPDEGYPLILSKEKNEKTGKMETTASCDLPTKKETWSEFFLRTRITDEQLIELSQKESLADLYKDVYTTRDFNMALDGLKRFDIQYKYQIFENEEFLEKLDEIRLTVPEYQATETTQDPVEAIRNVKAPETTKSEPAKTTGLFPNQNFDSKPASVPVPAMKRFIKDYITENYGADYSLPELSKEDLIKWYDLAKQGEELPFGENETETESAPIAGMEQPETTAEVSPVTQEIASTVVVDPVLQAQIDALRKKRP